MPVRAFWPGLLVAAILLAGCHGGSKSQVNRDAPLPGGADKAPAPSWYSKFLGLDKKDDTTRSSAVPERDPFIQPFDPAPSSTPVARPTNNNFDGGKPTLSLNIQAPPSVTPGQELLIRISARNNGPSNTGPYQIAQTVPDTAQMVRTEPAAGLQGNRLVWNLPSLPPGATQDVVVVYRPARAGFVPLRAEASNREAELGFTQATVEVYGAATTGIRSAPAQLALRARGPSEGRAGEVVTYDIALTNTAQYPIGPVQLVAELDPGLDHESGARRLEIPIPNMAAGETKTVPLPLSVRGNGRLRAVISATAEGGSARHECLLDVQTAKLEIAMTGPQRVMVGQAGTWTIRVVNPSANVAEGATLRMQLPSELSFRGATQGGQVDRGQVVWSLGRMPPRDERIVQVSLMAGRLLDRSTLVATASGDRGGEVRADMPLEIVGTPVLKVSLRGSDDAVEVGGRVIYAVELRNTGSLPVRDIDVTTTFPSQLKPLFGAGPTIVRIDNQRVSCGKVAEIAPGDAILFRIEAEALAGGDARVTVEAASAILNAPVIQDEATRIVGKK